MARRGPLTRAPGALKGGDTFEIVNIFVAVEGGTLWRKTNFRKKSHNAEKQRWTLGIFKHPFCCKISKKLKGGHFGEKKIVKKVSQCRKTERGDPLGVFQHPFCRKTKKLKGENFYFLKKSHNAEKN